MKLNDARIMLVDDEAELRGIFERWLRPFCAGIRTAGNGQEALDAIASEPTDILITDVRMPVMDGVTLVRKLAERDVRVPCIIFVSGFGDVDVREMHDLGVEVFLAKPFRMEELFNALNEATADILQQWRTPMHIAPRQSVRFALSSERESCDPLAPSDVLGHSGEVQLGRGGFSACSPEPLGLGKVAFQCSFDPASPEVVGQGFVRWRSRIDHRVGIKFAYLESPGREWVIEHVSLTNPRSFIPAR